MGRRLLLPLLGALPLALALAPSAAGGPPVETVRALDDVYDPEVLRVAPGTEVAWENVGRSPHTVTADDGGFDSGDLAPGESFRLVFDEPGIYPYHCTYHGAPGVGMAGVVVVGDVPLPAPGGAVGPGREPVPTAPGPVLRVPRDFPTIQAAVDAARPGGLVLVAPGVYRESVRVTTPYVTIRGLDRNRVILDGGFRLANGIQVLEADGVVLENMTARHYLLNGFLWNGVRGYRGSYLTAYANGEYGIFAYDSAWGRIERSYASGHPDSGFYIGQCNPCHAVITDVLAEGNALGFSGTNAGGDLAIVNSEWRGNMAGIVPNTLDSEADPPQRGALVAGNWVHDNDRLDVPAEPLQYPSYGIGILVTGGRDDQVVRNLVEGHPAFGIALLPMLDQRLWVTSGNLVRENLVRGSGIADLALGAPAAGGDRFCGNDFRTSAPAAIEWLHGCGLRLQPGGGGEPGVTIEALLRFLDAMDGRFPHADWRDAPPPRPQPSMPDPARAPVLPAIPREAVPGAYEIRDARALDRPAPGNVRKEPAVLATPLAVSWWGLLVGLYGYVLPVVLYAAWVSISLWDLVRRDELTTGTRVGWMAVVLLVPFAGPVAYLALARSPIPAAMRAALVLGGIVAYLAVAALGALLGAG